jgi:hypothetical protein
MVPGCITGSPETLQPTTLQSREPELPLQRCLYPPRYRLCRIQTYSLPAIQDQRKSTRPGGCHHRAPLWVEQRDATEVVGNVRSTLQTIDKNEEFIKMTLAMQQSAEAV